MESLAWAIAAYMSNPEDDDDKIADLLVHHGVPEPLAVRLTVMLPLAFGRRVLHGLVTLPDEVRADGKPLKLSEDPVFAAAWNRARDATRDEVNVIGMRSSEVHGINSALHGGSKPEDLTLATALPEVAIGPANDPAWAHHRLTELARAHGSKLAWEARVYPSHLTRDAARYQIDVVVPAPGNRTAMESFAGTGSTIAACVHESLGKFASGSLHVLLAVLEDETLGADQVEWETWTGPHGSWRACVGPLLRQWSNKTPVDFAAYLDAVKTKFLAEPRTPELHWHRTFVAISKDGLLGHDSLIDNDVWDAGVELLVNWPFPRVDEPYALRLVVAMMPVIQ